MDLRIRNGDKNIMLTSKWTFIRPWKTSNFHRISSGACILSIPRLMSRSVHGNVQCMYVTDEILLKTDWVNRPWNVGQGFKLTLHFCIYVRTKMYVKQNEQLFTLGI